MGIFIGRKHKKIIQKRNIFLYKRFRKKKYFNLIIYFPTNSLLCFLIAFNKSKSLPKLKILSFFIVLISL